MVDTHGLPLDITVALCRDHGLVPSWAQFWVRAREKGWKLSGTLTKLKNAVAYVYGQDYLVEWERRMQLFIESDRVGQKGCPPEKRRPVP